MSTHRTYTSQSARAVEVMLILTSHIYIAKRACRRGYVNPCSVRGAFTWDETGTSKKTVLK